MKKTSLFKTLSVSVFVSLLAATANANELSGIRKNNSGVKKFTQEKPVEAFEDFADALAELPFTPEAHFNLGNAFFAMKEPDKAISEFNEAIRLAPGDSERAKDVRFRALFNKASTLAELKKVDEALEVYQQALDILPDSKETKTNIELLTAQGGGGQGESPQEKPKDGDDKKEGEGDQQQQQQPPKPKEGEKPKPKPFKSEELTNQDVNRILDELKRQEEQIRAKMERQNAKDAPPDKDW
ncbi:MAG: tetratricopeptide repeat protein [Bdellovibrionota bacterium]